MSPYAYWATRWCLILTSFLTQVSEVLIISRIAACLTYKPRTFTDLSRYRKVNPYLSLKPVTLGLQAFHVSCQVLHVKPVHLLLKAHYPAHVLLQKLYLSLHFVHGMPVPLQAAPDILAELLEIGRASCRE